MRMEVDEAWRDDKSARVDLPCRPGIRQSSNGRDAVAADPDVGGEGRIARAIDDAPAADQEVVGALLRARSEDCGRCRKEHRENSKCHPHKYT